MNKREFRIGNLISTDSGIYPVVSVSENGIGIDNWLNSILSEVGPVVLANEWLIRSGFVYEDGLWNLERFYLTDKFEPYFSTTDPYYAGTYGMPLKFVHRLQNLYFFLYEEELVFKQK